MSWVLLDQSMMYLLPPHSPPAGVQVNTFQVLLAIANSTSWALFLFKNIQWTMSHGCGQWWESHNGLGGIIALVSGEPEGLPSSQGGMELTWLTLSSITPQVGFNSQQRDYFALPVCRTSDILCLADTSNVSILGC